VKKTVIIELSENEIYESYDYDLNPAVRNFKSLFRDEIPARINDLQSAISFYESLSDEEIERRYSIHYWETCTLGAYDSLREASFAFFYRSIDRRELARREIQKVELLLNEGKCQIMPCKEYLLINEIPALYEKLITGTWPDFFIAEELESYERAQEENSQKFFDSLDEIYKNNDKENISSAHMELIKKSIKENAGPKYIDYFNTDWIASMQIQGLIWYKEFLKNVIKTGKLYFSSQTEKKKDQLVRKNKRITFKKLRPSNDGYNAIKASFDDLSAANDRSPKWFELMAYMAEHPPQGCILK
jgi:hypothetical protein